MSEQNKETAAKVITGAAMAKHFEVWTGDGKVTVRTFKGTGEIYIDKECKWGAVPGKTTIIEAEPGKHRVGVYMGGNFIFDQDVTVPAEGGPMLVFVIEEPKETKYPETMTVKTESVLKLREGLLALSDLLNGLLPKPESKPEAGTEAAPEAK